jgi:hypothetical protein
MDIVPLTGTHVANLETHQQLITSDSGILDQQLLDLKAHVTGRGAYVNYAQLCALIDLSRELGEHTQVLYQKLTDYRITYPEELSDPGSEKSDGEEQAWAETKEPFRAFRECWPWSIASITGSDTCTLFTLEIIPPDLQDHLYFEAHQQEACVAITELGEHYQGASHAKSTSDANLSETQVIIKRHFVSDYLHTETQEMFATCVLFRYAYSSPRFPCVTL